MSDENKKLVPDSSLEKLQELPNKILDICNTGVGRCLPNGRIIDGTPNPKAPLVNCWKNNPNKSKEPNTRPCPDLPEGCILNTMTLEQAINYSGAVSVGLVLQGDRFPDNVEVDRTQLACIDIDGVLEPQTGDMLYPKLNSLLTQAFGICPELYVEKSLRHGGLHIFLIIDKEFTENMSGALFYFSEQHGKDAPKAECYCNGEGRQIILTNERYTDPNDFTISSGSTIPEGEEARKILQIFIDAKSENNISDIKLNDIVETLPVSSSNYSITTNSTMTEDLDCTSETFQYERDKAIELLSYCDCSMVTDDTTWLAITSVLKRYNLEKEWDDWCHTDPDRYNERMNRSRANSIRNQDVYNLGVLVNEIKRQKDISTDSDDQEAKEAFKQIFDETTFKAQWYNEHPQDYIDYLQKEWARISQEISSFDQEKDSAIEDLKNISSFERETVFAEDIVKAAAFAKIYDSQAFSAFKAGVQAFCRSQTPYWSELKAEISQKAKELQERLRSLKYQQIQIKAKIDSQTFLTDKKIQNFNIPEDYSISDNGIFYIIGGKEVEVCGVALYIWQKIHNIEEDTYKLCLIFWDKYCWKKLPAIPMEEIFNARSVVNALAKYGLPVASDINLQFVRYLRKFCDANANKIPVIETLKRGGWHFFNADIFVDPRMYNDGIERTVILEENSFTKALTQTGSFEEWRRVYLLIKPYPVARLIIAASIATPLLKVLGERNFMVYVYGKTTSGKSTVLSLGASAVGNPEKLIRTFDATKNGLAGLAATVHDYSLLIDEKQSVTGNLKDNLQDLVYALGGGTGRTKLNKDSSLRDVSNFRTIAVANGETPIFGDNVTGGANTRCLQIHILQPIISAEICSDIWKVIKENYGLVFTNFINEIMNRFEELRELHSTHSEDFRTNYPEILCEYCRYMSLLQIADVLLNIALGFEIDETWQDSNNIWSELFQLIPTQASLSDAAREKEFVLGFIAENQSQFIGGTVSENDKIKKIYGSIESDYCYITSKTLKDACKHDGFDYKKLVADLVDDGFFIPADTIEQGCRSPRNNVQHRIGRVTDRCFRIPISFLNA